MGELRLVLAGAAVGNGNRGVEALGRSVADAVQREARGGRLSILDDGWGVRPDSSERYPGGSVEYVGVRQSRRWHRPESWAQVRAAQSTFPAVNAVARRFREADAILDLSAGDSFTDLYGPTRLRTVTLPKEAALRAGRPLILLPQTYGPFTTPEARAIARRLVRASALAYARDPWSYEQLLELAGDDVDPSRLRDGVDVAFALEPRKPAAEVATQVEQLAASPVVGVNVSGLLLDREAHDRFGLAGDYLDTMTALVASLVDAGTHVLLVPHVHVPGGGGESDVNAITRLRERLGTDQVRRTTVLSPELDAAEVKWCISQLDWFAGSRMHSTIAALSTLTPVAAYAYSDKTRGVFETCGVEDQCVDARDVSGAEAVERLLAGYHSRARTATLLSEHATSTVERSRSQLREVFAYARRDDPADRRSLRR
ncbi:polysaccharide pyruvyl transferase family protein [Nocardioides seonyuensis]|uniref:Polysaccharide pyruvyl transferase family protein n=1 Tax=Nocardioides seonyuensis TaxID=2518371 RepID=A0A4P7IC16_9ACTN|nr:polysaccharide pyruvyl transferase family protein [Nocardioides seonyuensis]QBX54634.1 polysaccharide pyruvyl transferase family protein [Nocardioides seonyuensis]